MNVDKEFMNDEETLAYEFVIEVLGKVVYVPFFLDG